MFATLLLLVGSAAGLRFHWDGATMDFNSKLMWENGTRPTAGSGVAAIDLRSPDPVAAFVPTGAYEASVLYFPQDGSLVFAADGVVIDFSAPDTGVTAKLRNYKEVQEYDFYCHKNWKVGTNAQTGSLASNPPCSADVVYFRSSSTYRMEASDAVQVIPLFKINYDDTEVASANDLPNQEFGNVKSRILLDDASQCEFINSNAECICRSTCLSPEEEEKADQELVNELKRQAQERKKALQVVVNVDVKVVFQTNIFPSFVLNDIQDYFAQSIATIAEATFTNARLTQIAEIIQFEAETTAARSFFVTSTQDPNTIRDNGEVFRPTSGAFSSSLIGESSVDQLSVSIEKAIANAILKASSSSIGNTDAGECGIICEEAAAACADAALVFRGIENLIDDACPEFVCKNASEIANELDRYDLSNFGSQMSTSDLIALIDRVAQKLSLVQDQLFLSVLRDTLSSVASAIDDADKGVPRTKQYTSDPINFGSILPGRTLQFMINPDNIAQLIDACKQAIESLRFVDVVNGVSVSYLDGASRRRANDQAYLVLQANYTASCPENDDSGCALDSGNPSALETLKNALDAAAIGFEIQTDDLFDIATGQWDLNGVKQRTKAHFSSIVSFSVSNISLYFFTIIKCGANGELPSGACIQIDANANAVADNYAQQIYDELTSTAPAVTTIRVTTIPTPGGGSLQSSSSSASSDSTPVIAGAAAGAVVLLGIVGYVVLRQTRRSVGPKKAETRNAVAFENPMYDEGPQAAAYDTSELETDQSELYAEPSASETAAFPKLKSNPIYSSSENLADDDAEEQNEKLEGFGYLDVGEESGANAQAAQLQEMTNAALDAGNESDGYIDGPVDDAGDEYLEADMFGFSEKHIDD